MKKILTWSDLNTIQLMSKSLLENKLILGTTDTILGLFASVTLEGKKALDDVKKREKKPYIMFLSENYINKNGFLTSLNDNVLYSVIKNFWPGPLTIIFDTSDILEKNILNQETIAVRVPAHRGIQLLLQEIGSVFSTSANISGQPTPTTIEDVDQAILSSVEYGVTEPYKESLPSTIIRYQKNNFAEPFKLIREGAISIQAFYDITGISLKI